VHRIHHLTPFLHIPSPSHWYHSPRQDWFCPPVLKCNGRNGAGNTFRFSLFLSGDYLLMISLNPIPPALLEVFWKDSWEVIFIKISDIWKGIKNKNHKYRSIVMEPWEPLPNYTPPLPAQFPKQLSFWLVFITAKCVFILVQWVAIWVVLGNVNIPAFKIYSIFGIYSPWS
jgi:hypothetical protein